MVNTVARGLAPVGLRSSPKNLQSRCIRYTPCIFLWRGSLLPLGREAAQKPAIEVYQVHRMHLPVARGLAPVGLRSGPKTCNRGLSGTPHAMVLRLLRSRTGASSLATRVSALNPGPSLQLQRLMMIQHSLDQQLHAIGQTAERQGYRAA